MTRTAMGSRAALDKAISLWGPRAALQRQAGVYKVGMAFKWWFWTLGQGKSWSAAFSDYHHRNGTLHEKIAATEQVPE